MSINYQKEILSDGKLRLFVNFSGISPVDSTNKEEIRLTIFAINESDGTHVFSTILSFDQIKSLYDHLNTVSIIKEEAKIHSCNFIEVTPEIADLLPILNGVDSRLVKSILDKANKNEKLKLVLEALSESEIQNLHAAIRQTNHQKSLEDLKQLLKLEDETNIVESIKEQYHLSKYAGRQPEKIFQNWIEANIWTLGIDYIDKYPARQIGINSESDLIMETTDGFIDLIELKRPKFDLFSYDESHKCYYQSKELSKVLGQCMNYLNTLDNYKLVLQQKYKFKIVKPRIKIIIGRSHKFNDEQTECLRTLNATLNQIQVITYDYLHLCGENIVSYYSKELKSNIEGSKEILPSIS